MAKKHFDCDNCGSHGKIIFKDDAHFTSADIAYCPVCGADIWEQEEIDEESDD